MGKRRYKKVSTGTFNPFEDETMMTETTPPAEMPEPTPAKAYTDWSVCKALGWKRRRLVQERKGLRRGPDWTVVNGEVAMTSGWCWNNGLDERELTPAGQIGLISMEVEGYVLNPQLILAKRIEDGVTFPVRVKDSAAFKRGMVFEARNGFGDVMEIASAWPRRDY